MTIIPRGNRDIVWAPKMPSRHATCEYSWEQAAEPIASPHADVAAGRRGAGPAVGRFLVEGPVRQGSSRQAPRPT
jgi:hypothetical protein